MLAAVGSAGISTVPAVQASDQSLGCPAAEITKTLANGASWRMCSYVDDIKGLVLEKIEFKPASGEYSDYRRVADQLYLALLAVPYDHGAAYYNDIPNFGFGGGFLQVQTPQICSGDTMQIEQVYQEWQGYVHRTIPGICIKEIELGMATHSGQTDQAGTITADGTALEVSSLSIISWYEYQQRVRFEDNGTIDVGLGATGDLAPEAIFFRDNPAGGWPVGNPYQEGSEPYAANHWHNAVYRVDFGIDDGETQQVEQWDYEYVIVNDRKRINGAGRTRDRAFMSVPGDDHDSNTWWRVLNADSRNKDGHPRSYEIVNRNPTLTFEPVTAPSVSFTNDNECQAYADSNQVAGCEQRDLIEFVAGDDEPLTDPVAWVNVGFHHIPRDEDQSPMPIHWQSFQLVPRDFSAMSPNVLEERQCMNGPPHALPVVASCKPSNLLPPRISADQTVAGVGTRLTATNGAWFDEERGQWEYSYMWFRGDDPILMRNELGEAVPVTATTYTVTEHDLGKALSVRVTASRQGFSSATVKSNIILVPGVPTPTPSATSTLGPVPKPTASGPVSTSVQARWSKRKLTTRQNLKVSVSVRSTSTRAIPTGKIQVRWGSKILKTATLRKGKVAVKLPKFKKPRTYSLRVAYLGNKAAKPSKSASTSVAVRQK
jgi:primary-amine oxidase